MNATTLVYLVFAVWCMICWNWYVCHIKQACSPDGRSVALDDGLISPSPSSDTTGLLPPSVRRGPVQYDYPTPEEERMQIVQFEDRVEVHFPYKSTQKEEDEAIDVYLTYLAGEIQRSGRSVLLEGYADFVGSTSYNTELAERRAQSIARLLIRKGVAEDQIIVRSFGDTRPQATNDTPEGRYLNRRVEVRVLSD